MTDAAVIADPGDITIPNSGALNAMSIARFALGAGAAWLMSHHLLAGSDAAAQFVNVLAPVAVAVGTTFWIFIKNRLHRTALVAAVNAPAPAVAAT